MTRMDWRPLVLLCLTGGVLAVKPMLRPPLEAVERAQNESYVVFCSGGDEAVVWTSPTNKAITAEVGRIHVEKRVSVGLGLFLDRIEISDKGRYTCTTVSKESVFFDLSVVKKSQFVNTPTEHKVNEYQTTTIRCEVVGEPKPTITWQRNGQSLDGAVKSKYEVYDKGLKILNVSKNDAGVFNCRALQEGRDDNFIETIDITLKVMHKPEWKDPVEGTSMVYGYVTGESNLTCEAAAQPPAEYSWFQRDGRPIKFSKMNLTEIQEPERSVLQVMIHNESVFDTYKCQAKNKLGLITRTFNLTRGEKPPPPSGLRVVHTSVHSATLKLASDLPDADLAGYRAQFVVTRPGQEVLWDQPEFQDLPKTDSGHYVIRDLLEDTSYSVRVATRGLAGLSDYANSTLLLRTLRTGEVRSSAARLTGLTLLILSLAAVH